MSKTSLDFLALTPAEVEVQILDGNRTRRPVSHFLDFVVNGRSLLGLAQGGGNFVTPLNRAWLPTVPDAADVLLGRRQEPDLQAGRVSLLVCASCGDLGCGALTAALALSPVEARWSDFRWEDGFQEAEAAQELPDAFAFDRAEYDLPLEHAVARVRELPYDEAAHKPRGLLWPWQWGWRMRRQDW